MPKLQGMSLPCLPLWQVGEDMYLFKEIGINLGNNELITIVGGGGKTTTLFTLAKELVKEGKSILVTTTTAIFNPDKKEYDNILLGNIPKDYNDSKGKITVFGSHISSENKLIGVDSKIIDDIYEKYIFDYILVEGDGSKGRPIKAPGDHEPVIPRKTSSVIGVIGLDSIDKIIDSRYVHRPEIFIDITDSKLGGRINEKTIYKLVTSENGTFKSSPKDSSKILLLNKARKYDKIDYGINIKNLILNKDTIIDKVLVCELIKGEVF